MEELTDVQSEYRRERLTNIQRMFEDTNNGAPRRVPAENSESRTTETTTLTLSKELACRICGLFVIEREVEKRAKVTIVPRAIVDDD